jgi:hypothetical protein
VKRERAFSKKWIGDIRRGGRRGRRFLEITKLIIGTANKMITVLNFMLLNSARILSGSFLMFIPGMRVAEALAENSRTRPNKTPLDAGSPLLAKQVNLHGNFSERCRFNS